MVPKGQIEDGAFLVNSTCMKNKHDRQNSLKYSHNTSVNHSLTYTKYAEVKIKVGQAGVQILIGVFRFFQSYGGIRISADAELQIGFWANDKRK